jgi:hypothetical protein
MVGDYIPFMAVNPFEESTGDTVDEKKRGKKTVGRGLGLTCDKDASRYSLTLPD